tara:strand:+ start:200 stop:436 length:237 start_codon:yes stop_codon:yes gene_type:complete
MPRCPRCNSQLDIEYDREGFSCGATCNVCSWPTPLVDCPKCGENMEEYKIDFEIVIDGEEEYVCEGCHECYLEEIDYE